MDVGSDELLEPALVVQDFIKAVQIGRPTVSSDDLKQHIKFTEDFGQEG